MSAPRDEHDAWLTLAQQHRQRGELAQAEAVLARAVGRYPGSAVAQTNHGLLLSELGRPVDALERQRRAVALDPQLAGAWVNLGLVLGQLGDRAGAQEANARAMALQPQLSAPHVQAGLALQAQGRLLAAQDAQRHALSLDHRGPEPWINLGNALMDAGDAGAAATAARLALARAPHAHRAGVSLLMNQQYDPALDAATLRDSAARLGPAPRPIPAPARPRPAALAGRRLRLGYVSADLWQHPVGWLLAPVLAGHDRSRVEIHCFDAHPRGNAPPDGLTLDLKRHGDTWHEVAALPDDALAQRIRDAGIDVLIDLGGHTAGSRLAVLALQPAPVQLEWLGYFASTGEPAVDAVLIGSDLAPPGAEAFYTEPLERLPGAHFAWMPPPYAPACAADVPGDATAGWPVTFGSFNNPAKLGDGVIAAWAGVLHAVPGSRLLLKWRSLDDTPFAERQRARFAAHGIAPERLLLRGASPHAQMLAEYAEVDIALDPFPFSGLITTLEALWMGVPVLTLPWQRPVSRQSLAVLRALGLADACVAATPQALAGRAAALAADVTLRRRWRRHPGEGLRARLAASPLADGATLARRVEAIAAEHLSTRLTPEPSDTTESSR